jgi:hypothetical protein
MCIRLKQVPGHRPVGNKNGGLRRKPFLNAGWFNQSDDER